LSRNPELIPSHPHQGTDALRAAGGTPECRATVDDRVHFLASGAPPFIVTREDVIVG